MWKLAKSWAILAVTVSVILTLGNPKGETRKGYSWFLSLKEEQQLLEPALEYDFYRNTCPKAEKIIRYTVSRLFLDRINVAPALLRLLFHDCFIQGCDASVLLDSVNGKRSEKDAKPNAGSLKGFDLIDIIKSNVEKECPGTVSCSDILVLAARDAIILAGGPFYPVSTGRRDSTESFSAIADAELPSPFHDLNTTLAIFATKGFQERETVSLLGAHSVGSVHCRFFESRLYNFKGSGAPDGSLDPDFRELLMSICSTNRDQQGNSSQEAAIPIDYESNSSFDGHYYENLLMGRAVLYADQQLTARNSSADLVRYYASDGTAFRRDFARAMVKLSGLGAISGSQGQVRTHCSKLNNNTNNGFAATSWPPSQQS